MPDAHDRQADIRALTRLLTRGNYSYDQSKHLFRGARKAASLSPPERSSNGAVERLNRDELEAFLEAAYEHSGRRGLMMRFLFESGARVKALTQLAVEDVSFADLEVRILGKGGKRRDVPLLQSLVNELRLHLGERRSGPIFRSRQGGAYSKRRVQQIVRQTAEAAGIGKRVYPHLLRHTVAQHLADRRMQENLLQQFTGHARPQTTQVYYEPRRRQVKDAHREAMTADS